MIFWTCSYTYKKPDAERSDEYFRRVNVYANKFGASVTLNNDNSFVVDELNVQADSTSYIMSKTNMHGKISTSEIYFIEIRDTFAGGIGGMTYGLIGGFFAILAIMGVNGTDEDVNIITALIYGPIIGGTIGFIAGAIRQDRKIFIINPKQ
jgi:hypothetical protein